MQHASRLTRQGVWTHWSDVRPFDLSWKNLIYGPGPKVIAFVLNAQINSVKTPDMLKLWKLTASAQCPLCAHKQCTLHHILVNCNYALNQGRYTWRHDSVLANIELALTKLATNLNMKRSFPLLFSPKRLSALVSPVRVPKLFVQRKPLQIVPSSQMPMTGVCVST